MIRLQQLSLSDGESIYKMLQRIGRCENEFHNSANGLSFSEFKQWLKQQDDWARGENLPDGYVAQTIFWLFIDEVPVGIGKIRHKLTEQSRTIGGNIGYAIDPIWRGRGYATILLKQLVRAAYESGITELLLTVEKYNPASKCVIEKNGGILVRENNERWFFSFINCRG